MHFLFRLAPSVHKYGNVFPQKILKCSQGTCRPFCSVFLFSTHGNIILLFTASGQTVFTNDGHQSSKVLFENVGQCFFYPSPAFLVPPKPTLEKYEAFLFSCFSHHRNDELALVHTHVQTVDPIRLPIVLNSPWRTLYRRLQVMSKHVIIMR